MPLIPGRNQPHEWNGMTPSQFHRFDTDTLRDPKQTCTTMDAQSTGMKETGKKSNNLIHLDIDLFINSWNFHLKKGADLKGFQPSPLNRFPTVDGSEIRRENQLRLSSLSIFIPLFSRVLAPSQVVVWDFFHQQYGGNLEPSVAMLIFPPACRGLFFKPLLDPRFCSKATA